MPKALFFRRTALATQDYLWFSTILGLIFYVCGKFYWVFDMGCTDYIDSFEQYAYFNNINSADPWI